MNIKDTISSNSAIQIFRITPTHCNCCWCHFQYGQIERLAWHFGKVKKKQYKNYWNYFEFCFFVVETTMIRDRNIYALLCIYFQINIRSEVFLNVYLISVWTMIREIDVVYSIHFNIWSLAIGHHIYRTSLMDRIPMHICNIAFRMCSFYTKFRNGHAEMHNAHAHRTCRSFIIKFEPWIAGTYAILFNVYRLSALDSRQIKP